MVSAAGVRLPVRIARRRAVEWCGAQANHPTVSPRGCLVEIRTIRNHGPGDRRRAAVFELRSCRVAKTSRTEIEETWQARGNHVCFELNAAAHARSSCLSAASWLGGKQQPVAAAASMLVSIGAQFYPHLAPNEVRHKNSDGPARMRGARVTSVPGANKRRTRGDTRERACAVDCSRAEDCCPHAKQTD
jgi:hypothetical protein